MSLIFATQLTALATVVLAAFAIVTAWYARRAFLRQSEEVRIVLEEGARQRAIAEREQADKVNLRLGNIPFPDYSPEDASGFDAATGDMVHLAVLSNESRRPIRDVMCWAGPPAEFPERAEAPQHAGAAARVGPIGPIPAKSAEITGRIADQRSGEPDTAPALVSPAPVSTVRVIRGGQAYGFVFDISSHRDLRLAGGITARFTDDAGLHWQLEDDLHLKQLPAATIGEANPLYWHAGRTVTHMTGKVSPGAGDPQATDWGGLSWSEWQDFDQAHRSHAIPATPGVYRFRARDEPGLLYIGESGDAGGRWARLDDLARGRNRHPPEFYLNWRAAGLAKRPHRGHYAAPYMRQCEDAGCHVEVSWALEEHPDKADRTAVEKRLVQLHRQVMGSDPPIQHGGRGVAAFLERRRANKA